MKALLFTVAIAVTLSIGMMMCSTEKAVSLGMFDAAIDVGECKIPGKLAFDPEKGVYRIGASGQNMWAGHDDFYFAWKKMAGDFILTARFQFIGEGVDPHRKVGWMVRKSHNPNSPYIDAVVHGDGLTSLQFRRDFDRETKEVAADITHPDVIQLEKTGDTFIMRAAKMGKPLRETAKIQLALGDTVYVGLAMCAHNDTTFEEAIVTNARIEIPAPPDFRPYQDYSGSRLAKPACARSSMNQTSHLKRRTGLATAGRSFTTAAGCCIGSICNPVNHDKLTPETQFTIIMITSFLLMAKNWPSKLAISNHVEGEAGGGSAIFVLPIEGGTPRRITDKTPSYLHGWSPDNQFLIYTALRNGQYDIYKIAASGGEEIQLTNQPALDDGSEYSPDGEWIYFNSARTGLMQIWRMKPDGSDQEQLTFDEWKDWFPHVSPDGQKVLFLSYPAEVDAEDHPHYKHVMLRLMPFDGGEPRVVAYLYGGQGTINVPSWSPDSKKVAFVSYSF